MHYGIMISRSDGSRKNIGDYIQSIAASVFIHSPEKYVEREELSDYVDTEKIKMILNGWFMWHTEKWPPSDDIKPLIISFHMNPTAASGMLSPKGVEYLKAHAPIGCRDTNTLSLLREQGIPAYFSGCLTLCLGEKYKRDSTDPRKVIFVDPYCEAFRDVDGRISPRLILSSTIYGLLHTSSVRKLFSKFHYNGNDKHKRSYRVRQFLYVSSFLKTYSTRFFGDVLMNAEYVTHSVFQEDYPTVNNKFSLADQLLKKYAQAAFVITSRIHCALPCLGMQTPVLFVSSERLESKDASKALHGTGRLEGLTSLFHCARYRNGTLELPAVYHTEKISYDILGTVENKTDYLDMKSGLMEKCLEFLSETVN